MSVQYPLARQLHARPVPPDTGGYSPVLAWLARRVAHKKLIAKTEAWRVPGHATAAVWRRRIPFLDAAAEFRPTMLEEYRELRSLALRAADGLRQSLPHLALTHLDWREVETDATYSSVDQVTAVARWPRCRYHATHELPWLTGGISTPRMPGTGRHVSPQAALRPSRARSVATTVRSLHGSPPVSCPELVVGVSAWPGIEPGAVWLRTRHEERLP